MKNVWNFSYKSSRLSCWLEKTREIRNRGNLRVNIDNVYSEVVTKNLKTAVLEYFQSLHSSIWRIFSGPYRPKLFNTQTLSLFFSSLYPSGVDACTALHYLVYHGEMRFLYLFEEILWLYDKQLSYNLGHLIAVCLTTEEKVSS